MTENFTLSSEIVYIGIGVLAGLLISFVFKFICGGKTEEVDDTNDSDWSDESEDE